MKPILIHFIRFFPIVFLLAQNALSQDVEPRRWTPIPLGSHILGAGYSYTTGNVFFDPLLEAEDVKIRAHSLVVTFTQPFKIGNKLGNVSVLLPFNAADWEGFLSGQPAGINRTISKSTTPETES